MTEMKKEELNQLIVEEMQVYGIKKKNIREKRFRHQKSYMIWQAIKCLRIYEYRCSRRDESKNPIIAHIRAFRVKIADRKLNKACNRSYKSISRENRRQKTKQSLRKSRY